MKDSSREFSIRSLIGVVVVLGLSALVVHYTGRFYYDPICERYAESQQLTFHRATIGWPKAGLVAECGFRDKRGNYESINVGDVPLTTADWVRRLLSWIGLIGGVGGSVWLTSVIIGSKAHRRRR